MALTSGRMFASMATLVVAVGTALFLMGSTPTDPKAPVPPVQHCRFPVLAPTQHLFTNAVEVKCQAAMKRYGVIRTPSTQPVCVLPPPSHCGRVGHAVMTSVKSEPLYLPLWLRHYSQHFPLSNLYVIHTGGNDTIPPEFRGANLISCRSEAHFDLDRLLDITEDIQGQLLQRYVYVITVDVDELLYAPGGLGAYLDRQTEPHIQSFSLNLVHHPTEPPLRWDVDVLAQRRHYFRYYLYDKVVVHRRPVVWDWGYHRAYFLGRRSCHRTRQMDRDLLLVHINRVDYQYCLLRGAWVANQSLAKGLERVAQRLSYLPAYCRAANRPEPGEASPRVIRLLPANFKGLGNRSMNYGRGVVVRHLEQW